MTATWLVQVKVGYQRTNDPRAHDENLSTRSEIDRPDTVSEGFLRHKDNITMPYTPADRGEDPCFFQHLL
jgi:hypothetical protein